MDGATTPHAAAPAGTSRTTSARLLRPFPSATPIHPPLRPSSPYSEGPRSEAEQKRRSRRTARTGIGDAQRARPWSRPRRHRPGRARRCPSLRRHRVRDDPGQCGQDDDPGQCGQDRGGVSRVWARAGPGVTRSRRAPSPACVMRARRNRIHPASRRASPARRNPPALDPRRLTSHNASPGDITKSTPPRLSPEDACGSPGRRRSQRRGTASWRGPCRRGAASPPRRPSPASGGALRRRPHAGRRGAPSPASGGALRGGPLPVCSASPGPRQAEPSRRRTTPTVLSRIIRSMTGVQFST